MQPRHSPDPPAGQTSAIHLLILRKFLARPDYLLILFPGAAGREKRARYLSQTNGEIGENSFVAFHHALVKLLVEPWATANYHFLVTKLLPRSSY